MHAQSINVGTPRSFALQHAGLLKAMTNVALKLASACLSVYQFESRMHGRRRSPPVLTADCDNPGQPAACQTEFPSESRKSAITFFGFHRREVIDI
jgi:hypothetical protein